MLLADGHIHFYPCYDVDEALTRLHENLSRLAGCLRDEPRPEDVLYGGFLAERRDCDYFDRLQSDCGILSRWRMLRTVDTSGLILEGEGGARLLLVAGRQLSTKERLEVVALGVTGPLREQRGLEDTVKDVLESGGIPVLSWAFGKWLFTRRKAVREVLGGPVGPALVLGDTSLRPAPWPEPLFVRRGAAGSMRPIIHGSDPLPFAGEERQLGRYASVYQGEFDLDDLTGSLRKMFGGAGSAITSCGKRSAVLDVLRRLYRYNRTRQ